jgi:hypothetical protein
MASPTVHMNRIIRTRAVATKRLRRSSIVAAATVSQSLPNVVSWERTGGGSWLPTTSGEQAKESSPSLGASISFLSFAPGIVHGPLNPCARGRSEAQFV